jgi:hypothetical protein
MTVFPQGLRPRTPSTPGSLALAPASGHSLRS